MEYDAILKHLKQIREAKGLTQKEVAERLGHNANWLSRIESGDRSLKTKTLIALCRVYGIKPEEIIRLAEVEEDASISHSERAG